MAKKRSKTSTSNELDGLTTSLRKLTQELSEGMKALVASQKVVTRAKGTKTKEADPEKEANDLLRDIERARKSHMSSLHYAANFMNDIEDNKRAAEKKAAEDATKKEEALMLQEQKQYQTDWNSAIAEGKDREKAMLEEAKAMDRAHDFKIKQEKELAEKQEKEMREEANMMDRAHDFKAKQEKELADKQQKDMLEEAKFMDRAHDFRVKQERELAEKQEKEMREEANMMDREHDRRMRHIQQQSAQDENNRREQARIEAEAWKKAGKLSSQQLGEEFPLFGNILQRSGNILVESGTILSKAASISLIAANTLYRASLGISESLGINLGAGFSRAWGRELNQIKTLFSTGALITASQQANTAQGFTEKFGSILTIPLEKILTQTARQLNLTGTEFLSGVRAFMPLVGSFDKAQALFTSAVKVFNKEGLTSREAAQFVAEKQELVARYSGTAATELLKAAAAARSAGFSLEKLQGFSDSIVTDFSSFLENAAELSALGINLPIDQLGQAALTGGAPAVMEVLNRTLGDITNLTQAQQVVLARSVGIPLNELLAISKKDDLKDSVKAKSDMEALKAPTQTAMLMEKFVSVLFPAAHTLLAAIAFATAKTAMGGSGAGSALLTAGKWGGGIAGGVGTGTSLGMAQGADATGSILSSLAGAIVGGLIGGPGGAFIGSSLAGGAYGLLSKKGDDVSSLPGYGDRTLQTQSGAIALNNRDTVIAYANDMKASSSGIQLLSEGALAPKKAPDSNVVVNVDINRLEAKLEQLQDTMKNMKTSADVYLDGRKVGTSLRSTLGVTDNLATTKTFSY